MTKKNRSLGDDRLVAALILAAGLLALWQCAPGFRPKHVRDIFVGVFWSIRGWSALLFLGVNGLLVAPALRLKIESRVSSAVGGLFVCLSTLLAFDIVFELGLGLSSAVSMWLLRLIYCALCCWGLADALVRKRLLSQLPLIARRWRQLGNRWWRLFVVLVVFFLWRQALHLYLTRGALLADEINFWYSASVHFIEGGFERMLSSSSYTPGIAWTIAFPARLLGLSNPEWVYGMPVLIFSLYLGFIWELSGTARQLLAGITALFFVFLLNRDLMALFLGSLYGEAPAALLTAVLLHTFYSRPFTKGGVALGLLLGYCLVSKPPLSILCLMALPVLLVAAAWTDRRQGARRALTGPLLTSIFALGPYLLWKHSLAARGAIPEYSFSLHSLVDGGVDFSIPWHMIAGLFNAGAPQQAYSLGLLLVVAFCLLERNGRFLALVGGVLFIYWGFVFGLYATLWQRTEQGSAGRYLAHAALALVLLVPLAFQDDAENFGAGRGLKADSRKHFNRKR